MAQSVLTIRLWDKRGPRLVRQLGCSPCGPLLLSSWRGAPWAGWLPDAELRARGQAGWGRCRYSFFGPNLGVLCINNECSDPHGGHTTWVRGGQPGSTASARW